MAHNGAVALLTGGAGFIGSHVIDHLIALNFSTIVCADDLSGGSRSNVPLGATLEVGDLKNASFISSLFARYRFDYVYHLAAYAAEGLSHFIRSFNYRNNLIATTLLINAAVKAQTVRCFVFTSSIAVYGTASHLGPMSEVGTSPQPEDPYGIAKRAAELDLEAAHRVFGLPYVIFRPHNVYGPRQARDRYRNVISIFLSQLAANQSLSIFGDGEQTRAFTYIDDAASPIAMAPLVPAAYNRTFNVGTDEVITVNELATSLATAWGRSPPNMTHLPARHEVTHAYASHTLLREVFGSALLPSTPLRAGIEATVAWAKQSGHWESTTHSDEAVGPAVAAVEVAQGLPPSWASAAPQEVDEVVSLERHSTSHRSGEEDRPAHEECSAKGAQSPRARNPVSRWFRRVVARFTIGGHS